MLRSDQRSGAEYYCAVNNVARGSLSNAMKKTKLIIKQKNPGKAFFFHPCYTQWGTADAEIKAASVGNTELSKVISLKPRVGQNACIATHASAAARNCFPSSFYLPGQFSSFCSKASPHVFLLFISSN